ncbi:MAG: ABC-F family ATP-binding cassette domain-containing protein [Lautropia sp.]|nr:ABC-F family ATP-binding cassette domain-containing protein [Lautropia sp.]
MIRFNNLSLARAGRPLFSNASLIVNPGERLALIGANGSGKSSLLALLRGELSPEQGDLDLPSLRIAWLAQHSPHSEKTPVRFVMDADAALVTAEQAITAAEARQDGDRLGEAYAAWIDADGPSAEARAAELLTGLGFGPAQLERRVNELSGGWKMRLNLACVLMAPSDLLLLDEPTNHLDLDAVLWLERQLMRHPAIQLIVSHDRDFLDRVATASLVIEDGRLNRYPGGYTASENIRAERAAQRERARREQQARIEHLNSFIARFRAKATKARQAQSRLKALERMETIAPLRAARGVDFEFQNPPEGPDPLIRALQVDCGHRPGAPVVKVPELVIRRGARIGILGRNGTGKTTLIRTLIGDLPLLDGELTRAATLSTGYLAQEQIEELRPDDSPLQCLNRLAPQEREQVLRNWLGRFGFSGEDALRPTGPMSGGEKTRLCLALLAWRKPGFLVLDEPTNHLDASTRDALAEALAEFDGPLLLVSHDRYLLRSTVDEFWLVDQGVLRPFDGDLDDYAQWLQKERSQNPQRASEAADPAFRHRTAVRSKGVAGTQGSDNHSAGRTTSPTSSVAARGTASATGAAGATSIDHTGGPPSSDTSDTERPTPQAGTAVFQHAGTVNKADHRRDRARQRAAIAALKKPIEKGIQNIEARMQALEQRAAEIDARLSAPDAFADREAAAALQRERAQAGNELERLENDWLDKQAELDAIDAEHGGD